MAGSAVEPLAVNMNGVNLRNVNSFCYLGSTFNSSGNINDEVERRIGLAAASFAKLSARVFSCRDLSVPTKVKVYKAVCISILLYCSKAWVPYGRHIKELEIFHIRCLQKILGLKWWHRVPHVEIRLRAGIRAGIKKPNPKKPTQ